jgi:SAM-dependent methyltransferase
MATVTRWSSRLRRWAVDRGGPPADPAAPPGDAEFLELAYRVILGRPADPAGRELYTAMLADGRISRDKFLDGLRNSPECLRRRWDGATPEERGRMAQEAVHAARLEIFAQLPRARRIVDLGGSCEGRPEGAMVAFGYPYTFDSLSIVELPRDERHAIYADICGEYRDVVATPQGPVRYVYSSLADLSAFEDGSIDLVYSGQSIEHVARDDADKACREAFRILRPGGQFCLDTPNRAVTKIQYPNDYINPDHEYEFTHAELSGLLSSCGYAIEESKGACLFARSVASGVFDLEECVRHPHLYDDIEQCYLLYYRCRKPC